MLTSRTPATDLPDVRLDTTLRSLDPASAPLTAAEAERRDALLLELVGPTAPALHGAHLDADQAARVVELKRRRRRPVLRWALPVAAAAVGIAVVAPMTSGSGHGSDAFASWSAKPAVLAPGAVADAEKACRADLRTSMGHSGDDPAGRPTVDPAAMHTVIAERRGQAVFLAMADAPGSTYECFFHADDLTTVLSSSGGLRTAASTADRPLRPATAENPQGGMSSEGTVAYAFTVRRVGPGVKAVTIRDGSTTAQATVAHGYYAAWWPIAAGSHSYEKATVDVTDAQGVVHRDAGVPMG